MRPEEVVAKVFGIMPAEVNDNTSNRTVGAWDSLGHITLVLELEATYSVSLSAEELFSMTDVASMKLILNSHGVSW
jgi:acyl carrier protein